MAVLTYGVYNDPINNTPALFQAFNSPTVVKSVIVILQNIYDGIAMLQVQNTVTVQKILQVAIDPLINYAVVYAAYSWFTTTT